MVEELLSTIHRCELNKVNDDNWVWKGKAANVYSVKDAYSKNLDGNEGGFEEGFHRLWKVKGEPTSQICSFGEFFTISCQLEIDF